MTDTPPTDQQLADRIAEVIRPRMLIGLQDAELYDGPGTERINEWADSISRWAAEVAQPELDRLRAELVTAKGRTGEENVRAHRAKATEQRVRDVREQWADHCLHPQTASLLKELTAALNGGSDA